MGPTPFSVRAYSSISRMLYPGVGLFLARRRRKGKEDPERLAERKGIASLPRPDGVLIWLHGASVGELISLLPIAEHFTAKGVSVLVTSGTVTSAEVAKHRLPKGAFHQYIPIDLPAYVKRFLNHWRPDIGIFAESELWPNLIHAARKKGSYLVIVNARMSERSHRRWSRFPGFITSMLSRFELALAQSEGDAERLRSLGAPRVQAIGNIKYDVAPLPADPGGLAIITKAVKGRLVFVAASTHPGEEDIIAMAHELAKKELPNLLTIIIPRHPDRGQGIADGLRHSGHMVGRRSANVLPDDKTEIYIADTIGELGLFYRLSKLAFLGGSLIKHGGQNPIEPAKLGNGILHGPYVHNFTEVYGALTEARGSFQVTSAEDVALALIRLSRNPSLAQAMALAAQNKINEMAGANQRTIAALDPLLVQAQIERQSQF